MTDYVRRQPTKWFRDTDNRLATLKRLDEALSYTLDLSGAGLGGSTISSVTYDASGPTVSNTSFTDETVTFRATNAGEIDIALVFSNGDTQELALRLIATDAAASGGYR